MTDRGERRRADDCCRDRVSLVSSSRHTQFWFDAPGPIQTSIMKEQQDQKIASLIEQLRRGEYAVDPEAVAVAILNRLRRR